MKKISFFLMAFGLVATSCTKDEFDTYIEQNPHTEFAQQFAAAYGDVAADQDWGFSSGMRGVMRGTDMWTNNHNCDWNGVFEFAVPSDAIDLTNLPTDADKDGKISGAVYVIPADFEGELDLDYKVKFNNSIIYNRGKVTNITKVNMDGVITFYNIGTMIWNITSGQRHTIINTGNFTLANDANVGTLYNGGYLEITDTDITNSVTINSKGDATINMPNGGDFKAAADIHGTLVADANTKIQNSNTQYICGIKVDGLLDLTQGKLESSYIEATSIKFDGDKLWLLPGGHVKAGEISIPNGGCYVYGETNSVGLIEVGNISFQNDNDFDRTFSDNIYFKITGTINFTGATNGTVKEKRLYTDAADYVEVNDDLNSRLNTGNAKGSPACGDAWSIGEDEGFKFGANARRIIAEDLAAGNGSDFDYNDVVFDAEVRNEGGKYIAYIQLQAAGGTIYLTVGDKEVHAAFGVSTTTMVNTNAPEGQDGLTAELYTYEIKNPKATDDLVAMLKEIPITAYIGGTSYDLTTEIGGAAEKIAVGLDYVWTDERQAVEKKYPNFVDYAKHPAETEWWKE